VDISRRAFLKKAGIAGAGSVALAAGIEEAAASGPVPHSEDWVGVLVDLTKCNGCRRCEAACKKANGFETMTKEDLADISVFETHRRQDPRSYTTVNEFHCPDRSGGSKAVYVKNNCLHCVDPACVSACLVKAMQKQPNGAVTYDPWKCMGCRYCMVACPFQIPAYEYDKVLTPQVRKCTFCMNEGNPHKGGIPACVQVCPMECLIYGKRDDLITLAHKKIRENPERYIDHVYGEREAGGTSWLYISGVPFEQLGFVKAKSSAAPRLTEAIQHGVFKHFVPPIAWCTILGMAMWLTKPETEEEGGEQSPSSVPQAVGARTDGLAVLRPDHGAIG
jgi:formate dehydrogenase iron-sulfur subunit